MGAGRRTQLERGRGPAMPFGMTQRSPFKYFKASPEVIRLAVMMYVRFPLTLRNVEDLLHERGIDMSHETVRFWWLRFGPMFAAEIRRGRIGQMRSSLQRWHLKVVCLKVQGVQHYLRRAVDHEGEVLRVYVTEAEQGGRSVWPAHPRGTGWRSSTQCTLSGFGSTSGRSRLTTTAS